MDHLGRYARWTGSPGTPKSWPTQEAGVGRTPEGEGGPNGATGFLTLPGEERSPVTTWHIGPRNLNMIDTNTIADNDVNGASLQRQGGIASGRNGSKAIQVVNQRNPCDKSKNREDKRERLFGCKDTTYVGT